MEASVVAALASAPYLVVEAAFVADLDVLGFAEVLVAAVAAAVVAAAVVQAMRVSLLAVAPGRRLEFGSENSFHCCFH